MQTQFSGTPPGAAPFENDQAAEATDWRTTMDTSGITSVAAKSQATPAPSTPHVGNAVKARTTSDVKPVEKPVEEAPKESLKPLRDPRSLAFQVDGSRIITTIVDAQNNTVVQQIPDADVIRLAAAIDRLKGFFLLAKA